MWTFGSLGFSAPWLLIGLLALPILWLILRAMPPAPVTRRFPGVALLLGLTDDESQTARTPWWLLLLRMIAVAAMIVGFAGPVVNPSDRETGTGNLLIALDGSWAGAATWAAQMDRIDAILSQAAKDDRPAAVVNFSALPAGPLAFGSPRDWQNRLPSFEPAPWQPQLVDQWVNGIEGEFETIWLSDGIDWDGRDAALAALEDRGPVSINQSPRPVFGLMPLSYDDGAISLSAVRTPIGAVASINVIAIGRDPAGIERDLQSVALDFAAGSATGSASVVLQPELRNRVTRFEISGQRTAGAVTLADDSLKRREIALISGREEREALDLLSPMHYLREALSPTADLIEGPLTDILLANPDVIVFADVGRLSGVEVDNVLEWVEGGGLLLRFAGPVLAASDVGRIDEDPLLPVRLRSGGRSVGGAMSWGEPKALAPFKETSPFFGLPIPDDVRVSAQVMAQPDPALASRVIAQLADGTPLVTQKTIGAGRVILIHVTANAEWSNLPLSGLFVQMLERLAISARPARTDVDTLAGTTWLPRQVLDGFGKLQDGDNLAGVDGAVLASADVGPNLRPGLYTHGDQQVAMNTLSEDSTLTVAAWPARIPVEGLSQLRETSLAGWLLAAALALLSIDIIASLAVGGRLRGPRADMVAVIALLFLATPPAEAQSDEAAIAATTAVVLGHILTGDENTDEQARAGLSGLSRTLFSRTSIEPDPPMSVDLERDELAFYPFLYWPITADQPLPSRTAYAKLNRYLRSGGMIMFDTRDADTARIGSGSPEGRKLQAIARGLDIPAIEPIPSDHVLTRTFYLLQEFPGRYAGRDIWVEASPLDAEQSEGMPFRNLNDGVTPVIIGGNDWARAWAVDEYGRFMFPVGRGSAGERQREFALRFGVNVVMHVLTGNYKSDQVHIPALLDRLGQ